MLMDVYGSRPNACDGPGRGGTCDPNSKGSCSG